MLKKTAIYVIHGSIGSRLVSGTNLNLLKSVSVGELSKDIEKNGWVETRKVFAVKWMGKEWWVNLNEKKLTALYRPLSWGGRAAI